jgi:hypothetical protein
MVVVKGASTQRRETVLDLSAEQHNEVLLIAGNIRDLAGKLRTGELSAETLARRFTHEADELTSLVGIAAPHATLGNNGSGEH